MNKLIRMLIMGVVGYFVVLGIFLMGFWDFEVVNIDILLVPLRIGIVGGLIGGFGKYFK